MGIKIVRIRSIKHFLFKPSETNCIALKQGFLMHTNSFTIEFLESLILFIIFFEIFNPFLFMKGDETILIFEKGFFKVSLRSIYDS